MIRRHKIGSGPNFDSVDHDITRVLEALPMLAVVIHGFQIRDRLSWAH